MKYRLHIKQCFVAILPYIKFLTVFISDKNKMNYIPQAVMYLFADEI